MMNDKGFSTRSAGLGFLIGAGLGAGVALLLMPQSGSESRKQLRGYARRAEENMHEVAEKATQGLGQAMDKGRNFLQEAGPG